MRIRFKTENGSNMNIMEIMSIEFSIDNSYIMLTNSIGETYMIPYLKILTSYDINQILDELLKIGYFDFSTDIFDYIEEIEDEDDT